jgi:hypothetical protein
MIFKKFYFCEVCDEKIPHRGGIALLGNISVILKHQDGGYEAGGIIGKGVLKDCPELQQTVYCIKCFSNILSEEIIIQQG